MGKRKVQTYIVVPSDTVARSTRLMQGTLRDVESKLRGEWEIRVATAAEAHSMADVEIEQVVGEP
jgi:hypothetical protein